MPVEVVFALVVGARFLLPLAIPRWPLPAIIGCLLLDGVDQTIFQVFGYDPPGYQSYDKAMDVYYLAIAYLATMRNWVGLPAFGVARFLYYYRLVGVVLFELTQTRALLLLFPNTFEYFFIAYEAIRSRWSTLLTSLRFWVWTAALIWVFVKLPQEYWIHVAQLDLTDTIREYAWFLPLIIVAVLALLAVFWFAVRPRLPEPDWSWRFAADPLPEEMDTAAEQAAWQADHGRLRSGATFEKVVLLGLLSVVFARMLPGTNASDVEVFIGAGIVTVLNAAVSLAASRRAWSIESMAGAFATRTLVNVGLVLVFEAVLGAGDDVDNVDTLFFLMMISLLTTMHDRWRPVLAHRQREAEERTAGSAA